MPLGWHSTAEEAARGIDLTGRGLEVHYDIGQTPRIENFPGARLCEGVGPSRPDLIPARWKYVLVPTGTLRSMKRGVSWPLLACWAVLGLACVLQVVRVLLHNY